MPSGAPGRHPLVRLLTLLTALAVGAGTLTATQGEAAAATVAAGSPYVVTHQQFDGTAFPPADWVTPVGAWSKDCASPGTASGCAATADVVDTTTRVDSKLAFNPAAGIPADLQNPVLSFTSTLDRGGASNLDTVEVWQGHVQGQLTGDLDHVTSVNDPSGVQTQHTVPLVSTTLPLLIWWSSYGDPLTPTGSKSLRIWDVTISGTVSGTPYVLTANPVANNVYPLVTAGAPTTVTLSGSSAPTGEGLSFRVVTPPTVGTVGAVQRVDATHATVSYTGNACNDVNGVAGYLCTDSFTYEVFDLSGNVSTPARVALDVHPAGAGTVTTTLDVPATAGYSTVITNGTPTTVSNLGGLLHVGPTDFPDAVELKLRVASGTISLPTLPNSGATLLDGTSSPGAAINLSGSVAKVNAAISQLLYTPPVGTTPTTSLELFTFDLGATGQGPQVPGAVGTVTISQAPVVTKPSLRLPTGPLSAVAGQPLTFSAGTTTGISVADAEATATSLDTVLLSVSGGSLALPAADTTGASALVSASSLSGGASLQLTGTVADLNTALTHLTFDAGSSSGTVTLSGSVQNPTTGLSSGLQSVTVAVSTPPYAFGGTATTTRADAPVTVFLCAGAPAGGVLSFTVVSGPSHGSFTADPSADVTTSGCSQSASSLTRGYTYTPFPGYSGADSVTYTVHDATTGLASAQSSVDISVLAHTKPTASAATAATRQDTPVDVTVCALNPDPSPALAFRLDPPAHGTVVDNGAPSVSPCPDPAQTAHVFTYTPAAGSFASDGTDAFVYTVSNGAVSDPATVSVNVRTRTPQVFARTVSLDEGTSSGVTLCATVPGGPVTLAVTDPRHGTLDSGAAPTTNNCPDGGYVLGYRRYTPQPYYSGADSFTYTATDGTYTSAPATISLDVHFVEVAPTADPQTATSIAPHPQVITLSGSSVHALPLTYRVVSGPSSGSLSGTAPDLVYTPGPSGASDSFTFVANDGRADSAPATVSVTVVRPSLSSAVCVPALFSTVPHTCAGSLQAVPDGSGGAIALAHTSGEQLTQLVLQVAVTNDTAVADVVTLTASAADAPWNARYATDSYGDVTAQLTGDGLQVTVPAHGTTWVKVYVYSPMGYPSPPTTRLTVTGTSGNDPSVRTVLPVLVQNGTTVPTLSLAQADGSGATSGSTELDVAPALYVGGPNRTVRLLAGVTGTGTGTFSLSASTVSSAGAIGVRYFVGSTDLTAAVLAGTATIQCYGDIGCPPLRAELTPGSGVGQLRVELTLTAVVDGSAVTATFRVGQTTDVGPDLAASTPLGPLGVSVLESTPVKQVLTNRLRVSSTTEQRLSLHNRAYVPDTFTVTVATTAGDSTARLSGWPTGTTSVGNVYTVPLPAGGYADLVVSVASSALVGSTTGLTLTATSAVAPERLDALSVSFPTYSFSPTITAPAGAANGWMVDGSAQTYAFPLEEHGSGPAPSDDVVVRAPGSDANFVLTYALRDRSGTRDVTSDVTGPDGLTTSLAPAGGPGATLLLTVRSAPTARLGTPRTLALSVTSLSAAPSVVTSRASAAVVVSGDSRLLLQGLPQEEPADVTLAARGLSRTLPIAAGTWTPTSLYGNSNDTTGGKAAYVSGLDVMTLRVAAAKISATPYRLRVSAPSLGRRNALPEWMNTVFGTPFFNNHDAQMASDPLAADGLHPHFTAGGADVTSAVLAGTWSTDALRPGSTADVHVSFDPPTGDSRRYTPLVVELVNATSGIAEDELVLLPSTILGCSADSAAQVRASIPTAGGGKRSVSFRAYDRTKPVEIGSCMAHLSTGWTTRNPLVLSSWTPATENAPAGGDEPHGLWLVPQAGALLRVDAQTLDITSDHAKAYVDTPFLDEQGEPAVGTSGLLAYTFVGDFPGLVWHTADTRNGLRVPTATGLAPAPFPLVAPSAALWPGNTMEAARYFQVRSDGTPLMVGEMAVNTPWLKDHVQLLMPVDNATGITLQYTAPPDLHATLPGDDSAENYGMFWTTRRDGVVIQGGCLGLPPDFLGMLRGLPSYCVLLVVTTYKPIPSDPSVEAVINNVTFGMRVLVVEVGTPTFNLRALSGHVAFVQGTSTVQEVVVDALFGVGPETPCSLEKKARAASKTVATTAQEIADKLCPKNYFLFDAVVTFKKGGFTSANSTSGYGIRFDGTLSFLGIANLTHVQADISSDPFNFHFANSPVAFSVNAGIPISAVFTLEGDIGALGFDIGLSGSISVYGETIASASGVVSSKGFGACGGIGGVNIGVGDFWGEAPVYYPSGCTTSQFKVTS